MFTQFINDDIVSDMMDAIPPQSLYLRYHRSGKNLVGCISISIKKCWFIMAMIIRIIGQQNRPSESNPGSGGLRDSVKKTRKELGPDMPGRDICERLLVHMLITEKIMEKVCTNFRKALFCLGEYVSGDEKLFHYTADSHLVRQVLSKPDRIGLWFYELCLPLSNNQSYLIHTKLHNNVDDNIPVISIVRAWADSLKEVGASRVPRGSNPNPCTLLCFDQRSSRTS